MSTALRISGPYEQLRQALLAAPLDFTESAASRRKRERGESPHGKISTFNFTISDADGDRMPAQIEESAEFLSRNVDVINEIRELSGVETLCLDFSWDFPSTSVGQYNRFPCSFLRTCAALGIDIEVSVYAVSQTDTQESLPPAEDAMKIERRLKSDEKNLPKLSDTLEYKEKDE